MDLLELKKKAVQSEDTLREAYSDQRKMKLGFTESASKLFQPITKPLEEVKTGVIGVKEAVKEIETPKVIYPKTVLPHKPFTFDESIFGLHQLGHFDKDEFILG